MLAAERNLELLARTHEPEQLVPVFKSKVLPVTKGLSELLIQATDRKRLMGLFYQGMTVTFYGGKFGELTSLSREGEEVSLIPDVVDHKRKRYGESKSSATGGNWTITLKQYVGYCALQEEHPDYATYFAFYKHGLRGIASTWSGTTHDLFKKLAQHTKYSVVLPFSLIVELRKPRPRNERLTYEYTNETSFDPCMRLTSSATTRLMKDPNDILNALGMDLKRYEIVRQVSPSNISIHGYRVSQFPIVTIIDKQYSSWVRRIIDKRNADVPF